MQTAMKKASKEAAVEFRCSADKKAAYEKAARSDDRSLASWIRQALDEKLSRSSVECGEHGAKLAKESE